MELTQRDKTLTLAGIVMALFLGALDQTSVAAALPKIVEDLQGVSRYAPGWPPPTCSAPSYWYPSTASSPT